MQYPPIITPIILEMGNIIVNMRANSVRASSKGTKRDNAIGSVILKRSRRVATRITQNMQYITNRIINKP